MNILIIDDHHLFTAGLSVLLQELFSGANISTRHKIADATAEKNCYDLILLDYFLPDSKSMYGLLRVKMHYPATPIVIISSEIDSKIIQTCIDHGAKGFVPKSSTPSELLKAMTTILAGGTHVPYYCTTGLELQNPDGAKEVKLSARQKEVLSKVVVGKSNKVIAKELGISDQTVKSHVMAVLTALGAKNRTEAVYRSSDLGI